MIVGNAVEARPGEFEGVVFLQLLDASGGGRSRFCSGILLSPRVVLTAGHCLYNPKTDTAGRDYSKRPADLVVWSGAVIGWDLDRRIPQPGKVLSRGAVSAAAHPGWKGGKDREEVDLGLVLLAPGKTGTLPSYKLSRNPAPKGGRVVLVGYGTTKKRTRIAKHWGTTRILELDGPFVRMGGESGVCFGDSGGPAFAEESGELVVIGVLARTTKKCDPRAVWATRVDGEAAWIESVRDRWEAPAPVSVRPSLLSQAMERIRPLLEMSSLP